MTDHLPNSVSWEGEAGTIQPVDSGSTNLHSQLPVQPGSLTPIAPAILTIDADEFPEETAASVQPIEGDPNKDLDSP
jgi:hypothetical protein